METQNQSSGQGFEGFIKAPKQPMYVIKRDGSRQAFDAHKLYERLHRICSSLQAEALVAPLYDTLMDMLFEGITTVDLEKCCILAAVSLIERDPSYAYCA
jgi:transcriptional regulator NrdR family protein